jgi:hypothetical protein
MFSSALNETNIPGYAQLVAVTNSAATLEHRVRSYLDANCSHCHRPGGGVNALFDARFDTPLASQGIVNGTVLNNLGIVGARVVAPSDTSKSILFQRDNSLADIAMPPLAKNVIDSNAVAVVAQWITSLPPVSSLPAPWSHGDIGSVGLAGDANYNSGQFTVAGSGSDIYGTADAFHYTYLALTGNAQISARVVSLQNTDPWAKAGVMFRESLAANSKHAFMLISQGNSAAFQRRTSTGGSSSNTGGPAGITAPYWVRLSRTNDVFRAFVSSNAVTWTQVGGNLTNTMTSGIYAGLAVTAHNNSAMNASTFDGVTVNLASNAAPAVAFSTPTNGSTFAAGGNIPLTATASDDNGPIGKVEFFRAPTKLGEATLAPYSIIWSNTPAGSFALTAVATDGFGLAKTSAPVNITIVSNTPPTVSISSPTNNAKFHTPTDIALSATASDAEGPVAKVEFYQGATKLGEIRSLPFNLTWTNVPAGIYQITACAYDGFGASNVSGPINVKVTSPIWLLFPARTNNGEFRLTLQGLDGIDYVVEATANFESWTPLATNTASGNLLQFVDPTATNYPLRFYRAREQ